MIKIMFYNAADDDGKIAKTILAGCYKIGCATLLCGSGATMTTVIEYEGGVEDSIIDVYMKQYPHGFNSGFLYHNMCPSITKSSWEHNNFLIEVYE